MATTKATTILGLTPGATATYQVQGVSGTAIVSGLSGTVNVRGNLRVPSLTLPDGAPSDLWLVGNDGSSDFEGTVETAINLPSTFTVVPVIGSIVGQSAGQSYPDVLYVKRHDTLPALAYGLYDAAGDPVTLPSGAEAVCSIKNDLEVVIVDRAAAVVTDGTEGSVAATLSYLWQTGDTSISGNLYAEFEVTYPGGGVETYPDTGYLKVVVIDDIA